MGWCVDCPDWGPSVLVPALQPTSWSLANEAAVPLLGFAIIATTIISTASLYRGSERRWHAKLVSEADQKADEAVLFAREMAHRLKNALAIVQSMSFQTIGREDQKLSNLPLAEDTCRGK
jgi:hypothetical protein